MVSPMIPCLKRGFMKNKKSKKASKRKEIDTIIEQYSYWIEWSAENKTHIGKCFEFPSLSAHGEKAADALTQIQIVVAESVKSMLSAGEPLPEPIGKKSFKGHFTLRIPSDLHRELTLKAIKDGVSMNQLVLTKL